MSEKPVEKYVPDHRLANKYRSYGGMIPYLMKNVEGMRKFIYEQLMVNCFPADVVLSNMIEKFPKLTEEDIPSIYTIQEFKKKINKAEEGEMGDHRTTALAMKDEMRNLKAIGNLNLLEEEMKLYNKAKANLDMVESQLVKSHKFVDKMAYPPDFFWQAVEVYQRALELRGGRLSKLDDLAIRYGYAPPKMDKNLILAQQNISQVNINSDIQEIIDSLDIKDEDLLDDKFFRETTRRATEAVASETGDSDEEDEGLEKEG